MLLQARPSNFDKNIDLSTEHEGSWNDIKIGGTTKAIFDEVALKIFSEASNVPFLSKKSHPENIQTFNNTMKTQINHIVDKQSIIQPKLKKSINNVLTKYRDCTESNALCCKSDYEKQKKCFHMIQPLSSENIHTFGCLQWCFWCLIGFMVVS